MITGRQTRKTWTLVEKSTPDRARVETGLRLLGRMIAKAYDRNNTSYLNTNGHHNGALIRQEVESRDDAEH